LLFDSSDVFNLVELSSKSESISHVQRWSYIGLLNDGHQVLHIREDTTASRINFLLRHAAYIVLLTVVSSRWAALQ